MPTISLRRKYVLFDCQLSTTSRRSNLTCKEYCNGVHEYRVQTNTIINTSSFEVVTNTATPFVRKEYPNPVEVLVIDLLGMAIRFHCPPHYY